MEFKKFGVTMAKSKIILFFFIIFFKFNFVSVNAYEIKDLIKILEDKNQNNSVFYYNKLINELNIKNSFSSFYPTIQYSNKIAGTRTEAGSNSNVNAMTHNLSIDFNLYDGNYKDFNLKEVENKNYADNYLLEYNKQILIKELILGYYNLRALNKSKKLSEKTINFYENKLEEAEILFEAGRISKIELLDLKNEKLISKTNLLDIELEIENLMLDISKLLDKDIAFEEISVEYEILIPDNLISKKNLNSLMNSGYGKYLSFMEKSYLPEKDKAKKDLLPSVDLGFDYSNTNKYSSTIGSRTSASMHLTVTIPIFNGYKKENDFDIKKYEYEKKVLDHKDLVKDFFVSYKENYNNYLYIKEKINSQKNIINSFKMKYEASEILFKANRININDLTEAKNKLDESINVLSQLEIDLKNTELNNIIYNGDLEKIINGLG
ncbi:MAG: hypothetical protein CMI90_01805 [Pelagibacteraceae bacterium]|nr:hypothetical protein [Pelagibacteraceae bacterium]